MKNRPMIPDDWHRYRVPKEQLIGFGPLPPEKQRVIDAARRAVIRQVEERLRASRK